MVKATGRPAARANDIIETNLSIELEGRQSLVDAVTEHGATIQRAIAEMM
jgi:hypothetical protein